MATGMDSDETSSWKVVGFKDKRVGGWAFVTWFG